MQVHMDTPNIVYYMFLELNIQYEYSTTLIFDKNPSGYIKNCCLNKLFAFYVILASQLRINSCKFI
jgi:hypothetical protein